MAKAGRPKGFPKTGGRKRGTPNKRTEDLLERIKEAMGANWCPLVALARIADDKSTSLELRVRCLSEIAPYIQPKRRAIEHTAGMSLEELVANSLADKLKVARERVASGVAARIVDRVGQPVLQAVTGVPKTEPEQANSPAEHQDENAPQQQPPPDRAPVGSASNPPPRLTAITQDMSPTQTADFDPYA